MFEHNLSKKWLESSGGPEITFVVIRVSDHVKRTPAKDPALNQVRVNPGSLLNWEVPFVDRTVALRQVFHARFDGRSFEKLPCFFDALLMEFWVHAGVRLTWSESRKPKLVLVSA